jgi:2,4-dienoyl-CoA reductase-like NADH-dependent reductase (Old Yellow Enzyme family)
MSILFTPVQIGSLTIENRFVHSATLEQMATEAGAVTDRLVKRYRDLAHGEVGLIIPGHMYVARSGRAYKNQIGIHTDEMIPGLSALVKEIHQKGSKIFFQLTHAGRQTNKTIAEGPPMGPSAKGRDPVYFVKPREMSEHDILQVIEDFAQAAKRAAKADADGIQIFAAHGFLINQFLSPFFNHRNDSWGGTDEKRFRFLERIFLRIREEIPQEMPIIIKLNTHDHTPGRGITPELAKKYVKWLVALGLDGAELSSGTASYCIMDVCRGGVPIQDLVKRFPRWKRPLARLVLRTWVGKYDLKEGYHFEAAKLIKPVLGDVPLLLVGGMRQASHMEEVLQSGYADLISMSRPFVRDSLVVKKIREGKENAVTCTSCNKCLAAVFNEMPLRCYANS